MIPLTSKQKHILYRAGYIICWSILLLYGTFPDLFEGEMSFDFDQQTNVELIDGYIFPFIMSILLFLMDVAYGYLKEKIEGKETHTLEVFVLVIFFLLGMALPVRVNNPAIAIICLIFSWTCLSFMKLLKTDLFDIEKNKKPVRKVKTK